MRLTRPAAQGRKPARALARLVCRRWPEDCNVRRKRPSPPGTRCAIGAAFSRMCTRIFHRGLQHDCPSGRRANTQTHLEELPVSWRHRHVDGGGARSAPRVSRTLPHRRPHVLPRAVGAQPAPHAPERGRSRRRGRGLPLSDHQSVQPDAGALPPWLSGVPERAVRAAHPRHRLQGRHPHRLGRARLVHAGAATIRPARAVLAVRLGREIRLHHQVVGPGRGISR